MRPKVTPIALDTLVSSLPGAHYWGPVPQSDAASLPITGIAYNSKQITHGDLFVALRGSTSDGHQFIKQAIGYGAAALLVEEPPSEPVQIPVVCVHNTRAALARVAARLYRYPSHELSLLGITGTNGKTSLTYLLEGIVSVGGGLAGVIGTVEQRYLDYVFPAHNNTTPESLDLQAILREMVEVGVSHVALEVSSHALVCHRTDCCKFDVRVFTNLSRDHLDFHKDFENYYQAKKRLFTDFDGGQLVINVGDPWGNRLYKELCELGKNGLVGYANGAHPHAQVTVKEAVVGAHGLEAVFATPKGEVFVGSRLIGRLNLDNMVAATAVGIALGYSCDTIGEGLSTVGRIPGRMEPVCEPGELWPLVMVDYAHTPDALDNLLQSVREVCEGRLTVAFGCGGDRDQGKRHQMGHIAGKLADRVILTSDNSRNEDPLQIIAQIAEGCRSSNLEPEIVPDRHEAILRAVTMAGPMDAVVVAGKGHENTQSEGTQTEPFCDITEARQALSLKIVGKAFTGLNFNLSGPRTEELS